MENVHDFKIKDIVFSGYLLDFKRSLFIPARKDVQIGDFIRMFEHNEGNDVLTGRNLMFKISYIDKSPGQLDLKDIWLVDLQKVETA